MRRLWSWFLLLLLSGCLSATHRTPVDASQLDVFGIALDSSTDYREIMGVKGSDEPCLKGYERTFEALDIVIGYGRNGKVRKVTTRNPQNTIFGVHPGEASETALAKIRDAGFVADSLPNRFRKGGLLLTLLTDGNGRLFGLILELAS